MMSRDNDADASHAEHVLDAILAGHDLPLAETGNSRDFSHGRLPRGELNSASPLFGGIPKAPPIVSRAPLV
jgi:hypothetical protein